MANNLPKWAWDLVIALDQYEDEHPRDGQCLKSVYGAIPQDVRDQAAAIRAYAAEAETDSAMRAAQTIWHGLLTPSQASQITPPQDH